MLTELERKAISMIDIKEVVEFLQDLIKARSDTPPGDTRETAEFCSKKMRKAGIKTSIIIPPDNIVSPLNDGVPNYMKPSVISVINGEQNEPSLLLNAHMDTVLPGDLKQWKHDPFLGIVEDGFIYGRGAGDDKGSVCAQVMAATIIKRANIPLKGTLFINPIADEEDQGWRGSRWIVNNRILSPQMVIVGEQTNNEVAVGERGIFFSEINIKGKAAHGAMPWAGNNAISRMFDFVYALNSDLIPELEKNKHPYLPPSTISTNTIKGGINRTEIIAEECTMSIDCRFTPPITQDYVFERYNELLKKISDRGPNFEWKVNITNSDPGFATDPNEPLIKVLMEACRDIKGKSSQTVGYYQHSDASRFAKLKVPVAIFGPSDPALGHAANERVSINQLIEALKIYILTIIRLLG